MCKTISINPDLTWVGALDPNLRIFDIIMETKFGTTYNSYVLNCVLNVVRNMRAVSVRDVMDLLY